MTRRTVIAAAGLILAACGAEPAEPSRTVIVEVANPGPADVTDAEIREAVRASLDSSMALAQAAVSNDSNMVISPAALSYSLAIAHHGASCDAADEIMSLLGASPDTYRHLAALLAHTDGDLYETRLTGLVLHASGGRGSEETLEEAATSFGVAYASVPHEEMTAVADQWLNESTRGRAARLPMPLVAGADAAVLTAAHYETAWSVEATALTAEFEFSEGRTELVPALDIGVGSAWETDSGTIIKLPTASPDPTYVYYPGDGEGLDLIAEDWEMTGDAVPTAIVLPAVSASSSFDIDSHRAAAGLSSLTEGGECGLIAFGQTVDFGSGYAGYDITVAGISVSDDPVLPVESMPDEAQLAPDQTVTIDRPFALLTVDADTGWAIAYAIINDPTR